MLVVQVAEKIRLRYLGLPDRIALIGNALCVAEFWHANLVVRHVDVDGIIVWRWVRNLHSEADTVACYAVVFCLNIVVEFFDRGKLVRLVLGQNDGAWGKLDFP